jgi:hypothetical protein
MKVINIVNKFMNIVNNSVISSSKIVNKVIKRAKKVNEIVNND